MMNLTTTQASTQQLPASPIKNVSQVVVDKHLTNNYPLGLMPLATQIAGHGSEGNKNIENFLLPNLSEIKKKQKKKT